MNREGIRFQSLVGRIIPFQDLLTHEQIEPNNMPLVCALIRQMQKRMMDVNVDHHSAIQFLPASFKL